MQYRVMKDAPSKHWTVGQTVTMTEGEASEWLSNGTLEAMPASGQGGAVGTGSTGTGPKPGEGLHGRNTK